ncbi:MAG: hypothetical protein LIP02_09390 [Bacteroidales bacterium]|nr:hypothetical protein [Bacteroidales bacterium]
MKITRSITALRRYNRSKGFGIHSPFAFRFVQRVLSERAGYYAYEDIDFRRDQARIMARESGKRHPRIISAKNARMLLRITAFFNPREIMQVGTSYGVSTTAMLDVDSRSHLVIYPGNNPHHEIYAETVSKHSTQITDIPSLATAFDHYDERLGSARPFMVVNSLDNDKDYSLTLSKSVDYLNQEGVVVLRNMQRSTRMKRLFREIESALAHGQTFTNQKIAVIVGLSHLQRQTFSLWF